MGSMFIPLVGLFLCPWWAEYRFGFQVDRLTKLSLDYLNVLAGYWPWMGSICPCRGRCHCRVPDGLYYPSFIPLVGSNFSLQFGFFCVIPWTGIDLFCYPLRSRIWVSSLVFLLYCLSYLLLWVLVFWKLRRLSGQPAEAKAQAYDACFEGVRVIGEIFEGLQHMGRVRQGRVERYHFSCQSHGLCPLTAVSSTVIKVGVCHQLRFLHFQVAISGCRSGFSYPTPHRYLHEGGSSSSCLPTSLS